MTIYAERDTNRAIPALAVWYYKQPAMPSYFGNAAPSTPRPDERQLVQTDARTEAMFGARRLSQSGLAAATSSPEVTARRTDDQALAPDWSFLDCRVYPDENVELTEGQDAHGAPLVSVQITPETAKPVDEVVFTTEVDGEVVPALLVTPQTYTDVYHQAGDARLAPGKFLGLVNAEMITSLFNPVFVVLLTPVVVWIFGRLVARGREVSTARKIFIGMLLTTIALLIMAASARAGNNGAVKVSVAWLLVYYGVITFGELCLSPMGLSLVTKLAPKRFVGLMMGGWFLATAVGNKLSGFISGLPPTSGMFFILAMATLAVAAFIFVLLPKLDAAIKRYNA
jgi:POT family proton-dependent oligopeptide transporter